jgi:Flp pilus assembly protein TadG
MLKTRKSRFRSQKRLGAIAILAAVCMVIVVAFLAITIDFGHINVAESEMQNAVDAGALSGARALALSRNDAILQAKAWAGRNSASNQSVDVRDADVEIGVWDKATAKFTALPANSDTSPNAVKVTALRSPSRGNALPLFLGHVLGKSNAEVRVSAVASMTSGSCGDIIAVNRIYLNNDGRTSFVDAYDSTVAPYNISTRLQTGDVCINGHLNAMKDSSIYGSTRTYDGKIDTKTGIITGVRGANTLPEYLVFPNVNVGSAATVNDNGSLPPGVLSNGRFSLGNTNNPGASGKSGYMSVDGGSPQTITLSPGTYYFKEMAVGSRSTIRVTGPTFIYVERQMDLTYGMIDNTTRRPINLQIYGTYPLANKTSRVESPYSFHLPVYGELHAVIYAPGVDIYNNQKGPKSLDFFGKIVGNLMRFWNTQIHVDESVKFGALKSGGEQTSKAGTTDGGVSLVQ